MERYPTFVFFMENVPLRRFTNKEPAGDDWMQMYLDSVSLDVYNPEEVLPVTRSVEVWSQDVRRYRGEIEDYIQSNNLTELSYDRLNNLQPKRVIIALTTGYLDPLFSSSSGISSDVVRAVTDQRKMEMIAINDKALKYAHSLASSFDEYLSNRRHHIHIFTALNEASPVYIGLGTKVDLTEMGNSLTPNGLLAVLESVDMNKIRELHIDAELNIPELPRLHTLTTSGDVIGDFPSLRKLTLLHQTTISEQLYPQLISLSIPRLNIDMIYNLYNLESLATNVNSSDLNLIFELPLLTTLNLTHIDPTTSRYQSLLNIDKAKQLRHLSFTGMEVTTEIIQLISPSLLSLSLIDCKSITTQTVEQLARFKDLTELTLTSPEVYTGLGKVFPNVTHLRRLTATLSEQDTTTLYTLRSLNYLNLIGSEMTEVVERRISRLT